MKYDLAAAMRRAALLTRASDVAQATRVIRDALAGGSAPVSPGTGPKVKPLRHQRHPNSRLVKTDARAPETSPAPELTGELSPDPNSVGHVGGARSRGRTRQPLGAALRALPKAGWAVMQSIPCLA